MTLEELEVLITANTTQLQREISNTRKQIQGISNTATATSSGIAGAVMKGTIATKLLSVGISAITSNLDGAISRLDTLNNYPRVMSNLGISSEDAEESLARLSDKLVGLPTTLDDAVGSVQRFTSANGNVKASTEMFLALNNAILSGGASTQMQSSALEQLSQAYAKGKPDMMEWRTAMSAMPAQLKQVAIAMGYASADQLGDALRSGTVSMNDFMKKITELNRNGANGFQSFEEQARNSTGGVATSMTNVKTAITRGLADIMNAIGQSNIAGFFQGIARAINSVVPYIVRFVKVCVAGVSAVAGLFGKKVSAQADTTAESVSDVGTSAVNTSKDMDKATGSANKLKKALNGLATFDEMNVLKEADDSSSGGGGGGSSGGAGDLGDLSGLDWDITDSVDEDVISLDGLQNKLEEIFGIMKEGFFAGFGGASFDGIIDHLMGIKDSLIDIWTDPSVIGSISQWIETVTYSFGQVVGSVARIGTNVAEVYVGSIDTYLSQNKDRVIDFISTMFDISSEDIALTGNFYQAMAEISDALNSEDAKQIGADIIAMVYNPLMSASTVLANFSKDFKKLMYQPIIDNTGKIQKAITNTMTPIKKLTSTISSLFTTVGDKVKSIYDNAVAPVLDNITRGVSDTFGKFLDVYNEYIAPVIDNIIGYVEELVNDHIKPYMDEVESLIHSISDGINAFYSNVLKPIIDWVIANLIPKLAPIMDNLYKTITKVVGGIVDACKGVLETLKGVINFIVGVFSGDWNKAWEGIKQVFHGIWTFMDSIVTTVTNAIYGTIVHIFEVIKLFVLLHVENIKEGVINKFTAIKDGVANIFGNIKDKAIEIWDNIKSKIQEKVESIKNGIAEKFSTAYNTIKEKFEGIKTFFEGIWERVKDTFSELGTKIGDSITNTVKAGINGVITQVENVVNGAIRVINNAIDLVNKVPRSKCWTRWRGSLK